MSSYEESYGNHAQYENDIRLRGFSTNLTDANNCREYLSDSTKKRMMKDTCLDRCLKIFGNIPGVVFDQLSVNTVQMNDIIDLINGADHEQLRDLLNTYENVKQNAYYFFLRKAMKL